MDANNIVVFIWLAGWIIEVYIADEDAKKVAFFFEWLWPIKLLVGTYLFLWVIAVGFKSNGKE